MADCDRITAELRRPSGVPHHPENRKETCLALDRRKWLGTMPQLLCQGKYDRGRA